MNTVALIIGWAVMAIGGVTIVSLLAMLAFDKVYRNTRSQKAFVTWLIEKNRKEKEKAEAEP